MKSLKLLVAKAFFSSKVNKRERPEIAGRFEKDPSGSDLHFQHLSFFVFLQPDAPLPADSECGGQRGPVCHLPVQRHRQDRGWRQALATGTVTHVHGSE